MAIAGFSVKTGGKGSAVSHAAYVARTGSFAHYTEKGEVLEASESGNMPAWAAQDPSRFWQAADAHERANGTVYREFLISLPRELSSDERRALVQDFVAQELGKTHAYQYAIHVPRASDGLDNPHVHLMFSERRIDGIDRDPDQYFKRFNAAHPERGGARKGYGERPGMRLTAVERKEELKALRERWEVCVNASLERAGHRERVNMKSYASRGLAIEAEPKQLPSAWRKDGKAAILAFRKAREAELAMRRDPSVIVERVSSMKALFTRQDLYRDLNQVTDDPVVFNAVKSALDVHPDLVPLETGAVPGSSREWLTTRSVLETEQSIIALGRVLSEHGSFGLSEAVRARALSTDSRLSDEQVSAVNHLTGDAQLAIVAGVAGAGKSTMLSVVRQGYEEAGYRVSGVALAGKAADELHRSSGIESRTLASWLYRQDAGMLELTSTDVIVMDEAGMVHDKTMERVLNAANRAGAKVILVGDAEQLQPIQAGSPFRSLSDAHGVARIDTVRRQSTDWQREATEALSRGDGQSALSAYTTQGHVHQGTEAALVPQLVERYLEPESGSAMILAHRKVDVAMLNTAVREARKARGELVESGLIGSMEVAVGDRMVFTQNDSGLGVLNGQFGEVVGLKDGGREVDVQVDGGRRVSVPTADYSALQHGYASTIHKSQGMTVDRAMLWGSASLDRHLGYVGMSRHREQLDVYQPDEASEVRSLEACLSRTTRAVTVGAMMAAHGLELTVEGDGRARLAQAYPVARDVDAIKAVRARATVQVRTSLAQEYAVRERAVASSEAKHAAHQNNEPPGKARALLFNKAALAARNAWENEAFTLARQVEQAKAALVRWEARCSSPDYQEQRVREAVVARSVDPLSDAGGVERAVDGHVEVTAAYPFVARERAREAIDEAERYTQILVREREAALKRTLDSAQSALEAHRQQEPVDSKLQVFLYQDAKQAREAWEERLPELEAAVSDARESQAAWMKSLAKEGVAERLLWERFAQRAPDALAIEAMTLKADARRVERADALRQYSWVERVLESTLGRSMQHTYEEVREKLVARFAKESPSVGLSERLQGRVVQHRAAVKQARELGRGHSRGRGGHGFE